MIMKFFLKQHWTNFQSKEKKYIELLVNWALKFSEQISKQNWSKIQSQIQGDLFLSGANAVSKGRQCSAMQAWKGDIALQSTVPWLRVHWVQSTKKKPLFGSLNFQIKLWKILIFMWNSYWVDLERKLEIKMPRNKRSFPSGVPVCWAKIVIYG